MQFFEQNFGFDQIQALKTLVPIQTTPNISKINRKISIACFVNLLKNSFWSSLAIDVKFARFFYSVGYNLNAN